MTTLYENFYRKYGIRRAAQLLAPPLPMLEVLELPKSSILHFVTTSPIDTGPASDDYIFRNITRPIMMGHIVENGDSKGIPRRVAVAAEPMIRNYHIKHRRFKMLRDLASSSRDVNTLIVYNYGLIPHLYHYARSLYAEYYKWWNIESAVWKNIATAASVVDRQQFIVCKLPELLPSVADLNLGSGPITQHLVDVFNSAESLMMLEIWKWLGLHRKTSVLAHIPEDKLSRVNFIFQESGHWFVMNLGLINGWRITTPEEIEALLETIPTGTKEEKLRQLTADKKINTKGMQATVLQKSFLRLAMSLFQCRTVASGEVTDAVNKVIEPQVVPKTLVEKAKLDAAAVVADIKLAEKPLPVLTETEKENIELAKPTQSGADIEHHEDYEKQLDADLAELEVISNKQKTIKVKPESDIQESTAADEHITLEASVMAVCDRYADNGLLSAAEYRRFSMLSETYKDLPAPDGKSTLAEFIKINPEVLKIPQSASIPDIPTVIDKTMLKSSLLTFDETYIKHVMAKDVAGMVMNIQRAGIAVTNYEVERIDSVMGSFDSHTVRVVPVDGAASTLRFRLPVIADDGTFRSNSVSYRSRKQKGQLPICKVGPDRVALTSYYGKVFVSRSSKRVNNYGEWLRNIIMAKGLSSEDDTVMEMHPGDSFDNLFPAPKLYTSLAMGFRGFTMYPRQYPETIGGGAFDLSFDHTKREALYGKDAIKRYEKDGRIIFGKRKDGNNLLVMDKENAIYATQGNTDILVDYGTIEMLLGLEAEKAPVEFAELKVMGRTIPIGVVLGYELGLEKLMQLLKVEPRRVLAGTRLNLMPDEYAIVFSDESLVFSRDNRAAALVLAGFNDFHRVIRTFSVYEFDKRGVYFNILETGGASTRYLREIDLMYQMFIDHITFDLLVEMKEPTTFRGLLLRSCELLLTDQHPEELDAQYMRIKGYERMAGAVYSEIVRSIRAHNGRTGKSKQPIDLPPYAVWQNISKDPSIEMVSDQNPIQNLKEMEAVTYSGTGGRNSRSMTKHTRAYHPNDMGTISESTVDSSDVSINTYLSADPQFTSLRGMSRRYKVGETGGTALLSTSALVSIASDRDD